MQLLLDGIIGALVANSLATATSKQSSNALVWLQNTLYRRLANCYHTFLGSTEVITVYSIQNVFTAGREEGWVCITLREFTFTLSYSNVTAGGKGAITMFSTVENVHFRPSTSNVIEYHRGVIENQPTTCTSRN